jgi:hypothetical protein
MKKQQIGILVVTILISHCIDINAISNPFKKSSSDSSLILGSSGLSKSSSMPDIRSQETTQTKVQLAKIVSHMGTLTTSDEIKLAYQKGLDILKAKKGAFDDTEYASLEKRLNTTLDLNLSRICTKFGIQAPACEKDKRKSPLPLYPKEKEEFDRSLLK